MNEPPLIRACLIPFACAFAAPCIFRHNNSAMTPENTRSGFRLTTSFWLWHRFPVHGIVTMDSHLKLNTAPNSPISAVSQ
jgi:hypothetical protein